MKEAETKFPFLQEVSKIVQRTKLISKIVRKHRKQTTGL